MFKALKVMIAMVLLSEPVYACTVCFGGDPDSSMSKGLSAGIIALLVILSGIFTVLIKFFFNFKKRARIINES